FTFTPASGSPSRCTRTVGVIPVPKTAEILSPETFSIVTPRFGSLGPELLHAGTTLRRNARAASTKKRCDTMSIPSMVRGSLLVFLLVYALCEQFCNHF